MTNMASKVTYWLQGSKGHFSLKMLLLLQILNYGLWLAHLKHLLALHSSCACLVDQRSNEVRRSTWKVDFLKIFKNQLLHNRCYGHVSQVYGACAHHIWELCSLSWSEVKWGHRSQKVEFTQNATTSLYVLWSCNSGMWSVYTTCMPVVFLKLIKGQIGSQWSFPVLSFMNFYLQN